jgi:hypothetical protein
MTIQDAIKLLGVLVAFFGGGAVIAAALVRWLGDFLSKRLLQNTEFHHRSEIEKLKSELAETHAIAEAARSATQQLINAKTEHRVYVSKAGFDVEFAAYRELWKSITALRLLSTTIWTGIVSDAAAGPLSEDKLKDRVAAGNEFDKRYLDFVELCLQSKPSIEAAVGTLALDICGILRNFVQVALEIAKGSKSTMDGRAELEPLQNGCNRWLDDLARVIRQRLAELSIVP